MDLALVSGLLKYNDKRQLHHAPFALNPSPISRAHLQEMQALALPFNRMAAAISQDDAFLREALQPAARVDEYISSLLSMMRPARSRQPIALHLTRSDYMLDESPEGGSRVKQVELNTISAGYMGLSPLVHRLHQHLLRGTPHHERLVPNQALPQIAEAFALAQQAYGHPEAEVWMVVRPGETNQFDQRLLEYALIDRNLQVRRITLEAIHNEARLTEGHLTRQGKVAAITYLRAGYGPEDHATPAMVKAREMIEASDTICVPDLATQMTGTKRVQQLLCDITLLKQYLADEPAAQAWAAFAGQYDLSQPLPPAEAAGQNLPENTPALEAALKNPEQWVLKPQREGGGHNHFDLDMVEMLKKLRPEEQRAYVLMRRLRPPAHPAQLVREGRAMPANTVSEIGIFAVRVGHGTEELFNREAGYLVRTKNQDTTEGGVSAGFGYLDSLILANE